MQLLRLVALGVLTISLAACAGGATSAPAGGGGASPPAGGGTSSPAAGGGGGSAGDVSGFASASTAKMCALLTTDEAKAIMGKDITQAPNGMAIKGLGTNCIYQANDTMAAGTFIKVEIGAVSYKADAELMALGATTSSQTTVGGLDATAIDIGGSQLDAALVIRLTDPAKPPSLLIQAPTLAMAKAAAEKVIPRLDTLR